MPGTRDRLYARRLLVQMSFPERVCSSHDHGTNFGKNAGENAGENSATAERKARAEFGGTCCASGQTVRTIERASAKLVKAGELRRIGPDKGGHWEVGGKSEG